jgi:guanosine-3',5'-bis(diphosphate) 3'-pyrophosphohydrolase
MKAVIKAMAFAADKHGNQRRKDVDASPYINHPICLANVLINEAGVEDERVLVAAVLHDTIEDTQTSAQELVRLFGKEVADIVLEVTDDKTLSKAERKRLQVEHAPSLTRRAKLVKLADKICNIRDVASSPPADWPLERKQEYFDWARGCKKVCVNGQQAGNCHIARSDDDRREESRTEGVVGQPAG